MNNIKGVRTITVHNESNEKVVLDFKTFAEAARYFDDLYANAVEDNYAEEVLFPILLAAQNEEYDYIDEDGYAVIEQDAIGIFEESCNKAIAEARLRDWEARAKSLVDDDFFVDFDEPLEEAASGWRDYEITYSFSSDPADTHTDIIAAKDSENDEEIIDRFMDSLFDSGYDEDADGTVEFIDIKPL